MTMEKFLLFCLSLITLLVSCGKPGPENIEGPAPAVESVTVTDGAEGVALA